MPGDYIYYAEGDREEGRRTNILRQPLQPQGGEVYPASRCIADQLTEIGAEINQAEKFH